MLLGFKVRCSVGDVITKAHLLVQTGACFFISNFVVFLVFVVRTQTGAATYEMTLARCRPSALSIGLRDPRQRWACASKRWHRCWSKEAQKERLKERRKKKKKKTSRNQKSRHWVSPVIMVFTSGTKHYSSHP